MQENLVSSSEISSDWGKSLQKMLPTTRTRILLLELEKKAATTSVQNHNLEAEILVLGYVP